MWLCWCIEIQLFIWILRIGSKWKVISLQITLEWKSFTFPLSFANSSVFFLSFFLRTKPAHTLPCLVDTVLTAVCVCVFARCTHIINFVLIKLTFSFFLFHFSLVCSFVQKFSHNQFKYKILFEPMLVL